MCQEDAGVCVRLQEFQGVCPDGLGQRLSPEVGGAERVGLGGYGATPRLVATHCQTQAECEDESHEAQKGTLHDGQGFLDIVRSLSDRSAYKKSEYCRPDDHAA